MRKACEILPVGNDHEPLMCAGQAGNCCYDVVGDFVGDSPRALTVTFIED
jgi:hypothetical protein